LESLFAEMDGIMALRAKPLNYRSGNPHIGEKPHQVL